MMKRPILYALTALLALFAAASCSKDDATRADGTGVLKMNISATRTEAGTGYDPLSHVTIRIYNAEGGLLRKYTAMEELPEQLELLAGNYRVAVEAGEQVAASTEKRFYTGEQTFGITPGTVTPVEVVCRLRNTVAEVKFDRTVAQNFGENFSVWTVIGAEVDEEKAAAGEIPALRFTADGKGYFTLPEGAKTLAWKFSGEHAERGSIVKEGTQAVIEGGKYTLTFRFSEDLPGYIGADFTIRVDDSTDDQDDTIVFSPDPTIEGEGFDATKKQDFIPGKTEARSYKITTMASMRSAELAIGDERYNLLALSAADGLTVEKTDDKNLRLTLSDAFFAGRSGGDHTLTFRITDTDGGTLTSKSIYRLQGLFPVTAADCDLWSNSVTLRALVLDTEVSSVAFGLRSANGEWQDADGVKGADGNFSARFTAQWQQSTNDAGLTVYTPIAGTGVFAAGTYEYRADLGSGTTSATFTTAAGDTIYNAGMELWSTYTVTGGSFTGGVVPYPNESSGKEFWVGGNNKTTNSLCTGGATEGCNGAKCAVLQPVSAAGIFAAGNLFTGTFECGTGVFDMFGYARFGVKYSFSARPTALRVHCKATVTNVTNTGSSSLSTDDIDPARIYVVVTDWSSRHSVKSGKSFDESTFWDPVKTSSLAEGPLLGYGSHMFTQSTDGWITLTLPISWYDKDKAPAANNFSLSISCVSSNYGDYVAGSVNNQLCVEDFEWVY